MNRINSILLKNINFQKIEVDFENYNKYPLIVY